MASNIERFRTDIARLVDEGERLCLSMTFECFPEQRAKAVETVMAARKKSSDKAAKAAKATKVLKVTASANDAKVDTSSKTPFSDLPLFSRSYQKWYSEALAVIRQLLPDRLSDFQSHYEVPRNRKELAY